jgi:hypothetical protein
MENAMDLPSDYTAMMIAKFPGTYFSLNSDSSGGLLIMIFLSPSRQVHGVLFLP